MLSKMKNRKIIAIVAGSVLVLIVAVVIFFAYRPGFTLKEVPADWTKTQDLKLNEGALGVVYKGTGTLEQALAVFKASFEKTGWSHVKDILQEDLNSATFRQGEQQAEVIVMGPAPNITVHILVSEARPEEVKKPEVPKIDVAGKDISEIPRYPNSTRTKYESAPKEFLLEYLALAGVQTVAEFYVGQLPTTGWAIQAMTIENERAKIIGFKTELEALVTVYIESDKLFTGYTRIQVVIINSK